MTRALGLEEREVGAPLLRSSTIRALAADPLAGYLSPGARLPLTAVAVAVGLIGLAGSGVGGELWGRRRAQR